MFLASALILSSCDSKMSLSKEIEGTWASNAESVTAPGSLNATATYMLQFTPDRGNDPKSGNFMMMAQIGITDMGAPDDISIQAYSVTAAGIVSAMGQYTVTDDDEVSITMSPESFSVEVDPKAVILENNLLTGSDTPSTNDSLSTIYASHVKSRIAETFRNQFISLKKIDDIEIKHDEMKCEIRDRDIFFHKQ